MAKALASWVSDACVSTQQVPGVNSLSLYQDLGGRVDSCGQVSEQGTPKALSGMQHGCMTLFTAPSRPFQEGSSEKPGLALPCLFI